MNIVIIIIKIIFLSISLILIVSSCIRLFRWRKSAFDSSSAILRNLRYFHLGERLSVHAPDKPGIRYVRSGRSSKTMVYWEYCYTVDGIRYCKSYFHEDDETELPSKIRIHYNRKNPKIMYRDGELRDGVFISAVSIILGVLFLFAVAASYIW